MSKHFIDLHEKQCKYKRSFPSRRIARRSMRRRYTEYRNMNAYICPWCGMWHVGHKKGTKKKSKNPDGQPQA